jgi:hypothetical protein
MRRSVKLKCCVVDSEKKAGLPEKNSSLLYLNGPLTARPIDVLFFALCGCCVGDAHYPCMN